MIMRDARTAGISGDLMTFAVQRLPLIQVFNVPPRQLLRINFRCWEKNTKTPTEWYPINPERFREATMHYQPETWSGY